MANNDGVLYFELWEKAEKEKENERERRFKAQQNDGDVLKQQFKEDCENVDFNENGLNVHNLKDKTICFDKFGG